MSESLNGIPCEGWTKVTLGDIARNITENEYKPSEKGLDRCVGLEHLDPGSLKICRWSPITPEMSFTRRFYRGQILFGKRRAYQKKVALADFDGICSSDILVIETKKGNFVPDLLPFIVQDDRFFEYAVGTSSGSLSPRTKWKYLADYEIWLPSLDEQRRIATTLWAAEDCIVKGERLVVAAERAKQVLMRELFSKGIGHKEFQEVRGFGSLPKKWEVLHLSDLLVESIRNGAFIQKNNSDIVVPFLNVVDVYKNSVVNISELEKVQCSKADYENYQLQENDLLYVRSSLRREGIAQCCMVGYLPQKTIFDCHLMRVKLNEEKYYPKYVLFYSISTRGRKQLLNLSKTTTMSTVDQKDLGSFSIPIPPLPEQRQIASILTRCDETIAAARANVGAAKALKMKMINEMLVPQNSG